MECLKCKSSNPESKKYCGDCGALLDPSVGMVEAYLDTNLRPQLQSILKEHYKDSKLVEMEITESVVTKLSSWGKHLAYFVGIPLGALLFVLGVLGIKSYADFVGIINTAKRDTEQTLEKAKQEGDSLMGEYEKLRAQLADVRNLANEVETLTTKVENIENKIGIESSANLTPELKKNLESSFSVFIQYLERLGFKHRGRPVRVQVSDKLGENAMYIPNENRILIAPPFSGDKQVAYYTYTVYALSSIHGNGAGLVSLSSGLSDYFACSFSNNPLIGEIAVKELQKKHGNESYNKPYFRNLENSRRFEGADMNSIDGGEIWGGAFWEIRKLLGQEKADKLLFSAWSAMGRSDLRGNGNIKYVSKLIETNQSLHGDEHSGELRSIFERRGLRF